MFPIPALSYQSLGRDADALNQEPSMAPVHKRNRKFMQTLQPLAYKTLERIAKERGLTVQELIRAIVIPEWLSWNKKD